MAGLFISLDILEPSIFINETRKQPIQKGIPLNIKIQFPDSVWVTRVVRT